MLGWQGSLDLALPHDCRCRIHFGSLEFGINRTEARAAGAAGWSEIGGRSPQGARGCAQAISPASPAPSKFVEAMCGETRRQG